MKRLKTIRRRAGTLIVETPLGLVNITVGLRDVNGRRVDSISVSPNDAGIRLVQGRSNMHLVELTKEGGAS